MKSLRNQFIHQQRMAQFISNMRGIKLDLVMVYRKGLPTRISIIGNAISQAAYTEWSRQGSQFKILQIIKPTN